MFKACLEVELAILSRRGLIQSEGQSQQQGRVGNTKVGSPQTLLHSSPPLIVFDSFSCVCYFKLKRDHDTPREQEKVTSSFNHNQDRPLCSFYNLNQERHLFTFNFTLTWIHSQPIRRSNLKKGQSRFSQLRANAPSSTTRNHALQLVVGRRDEH